MTILKARVRREGQLAEIPAGQLVPGDIVAIGAGDGTPAAVLGAYIVLCPASRVLTWIFPSS